MKKIDFEAVVRRAIEAGAKRLVVVYNPRSSKAGRVEEEVIRPAKEILRGAGDAFGGRGKNEAEKRGAGDDGAGAESVGAGAVKYFSYEVQPTNVDDNAAKLAKVLKDGDAVVAAGGDGTAAIAMNGCMLSEREVFLAAVPFGNFNDMARSLQKAGAGGAKLYPIEAEVDGKHFRYAACYFTIGLFAESTEIFDGKKMRGSLQKGNKGMIFSVTNLAKWYFKNKKREFMPKFSIERQEERGGETISVDVRAGTSDYMAVNGASVAKMMRGGEWYLSDAGFLAGTQRLGSFFRLCGFMGRSVVFRVPGRKVYQDRLIFEKPATVEIQAEGEYKRLEKVKEIRIRKAKKCIKIL